MHRREIREREGWNGIKKERKTKIIKNLVRRTKGTCRGCSMQACNSTLEKTNKTSKKKFVFTRKMASILIRVPLFKTKDNESDYDEWG